MGRNHTIPGVEKKTVKSCAYETQVLLGNIKPKVKRRVEDKPRKPYDRAEDRLRTEIVRELKAIGCKVWRIEPSFRGRFGLGDLYVITRSPTLIHIWLEVKTKKGKQTKDQELFQVLCDSSCNAYYYIVRSVEEALECVK